jgi:insulin receptor substrate 1
LEIEGEGTNNEHHWGTEAGNPIRWFPDLINQLNCVVGTNYEEWMTNEGFEEDYLFFDGPDCCEKWYPDKADCPSNMEAVDPEAEDEPYHSSPYSMDNYYFPDFSDNTCKFGRDYPAWMGINGYEKHYLFRTVGECCTRYFNGGSCGASSTTPQTGYFWSAYQDELANDVAMPVRYNHTFYPDISSKTCVNGTDYPAWMADDDEFKRLYLFSTLDGCCTHWYTTGDKQDCVTNVVQGVYLGDLPCHQNRPDEGPATDASGNEIPCDELLPDHNHPWQNAQPIELTTKWYPDLDGLRCKDDGHMESWMLHEDYQEWYLFNTQQQCCAAFGFCT